MSPPRPDRPTLPNRDASSWNASPWTARAIRWTALVLPTLLSFFVTFAAARNFTPANTGLATPFWWICLFTLGFVVLLSTERVTRGLLPLSALFKLSLVFPDEAPSRFGIALKTNSTRKVERRIAQVRESGFPTDETEYAEAMLELVAGLSLHDRLTRGHSERVRAYADMIAEEMHLTNTEASKLRWASLLHDVGKIFVPAEILNKPGRPTTEEWEILKSHTWKGDELIEPLRGFLGTWGPAVRNHHERWDGNGYPDKLAGEDIPLGARIVAVADAYDVMTSARSYKEPRPATEARAEIAACSGGQFDPRVARAFLNIGLGRLRFAAGPLSWLANFQAATQLPVAQIGQGAAVLLTSGAVAISGSLGAPPQDGDLAFTQTTTVVQTSTTLAPTTLSLPTLSPTTLPPTTRPLPTAPPTVLVAVETISPTSTTIPTTAIPTTAIPTTAVPATTIPSTTAPTTTAAPTTTTTPPPAAPSPQLIARLFPEDTSITVDRTALVAGANDIDSSGDALTFTIPTVPSAASGSIVINTDSDGRFLSLTFTPEADFVGDAVAVYEACDERGDCGRGDIRFATSPVNDLPVAKPDSATTVEDTPIELNQALVLGNDSDVDGDTLTVAWPITAGLDLTSNPPLFTPPANYVGIYNLGYQACDGSDCVASILEIDVTAVDDPPAPQLIARRVKEDTVIIINRWILVAGASDVDTADEDLTFSFPVQPDPALGTLAETRDADGALVTALFLPQADAVGVTFATYTVCDGSNQCASASITIELTPVDDLPVAVGESFNLDEDEVFSRSESSLLSNDYDVDGEALTIEWGVLPPGVTTLAGTVAFNIVDFNGQVQIPYQVCTIAGACSDPIDIQLSFAAVNDAPSGQPDTLDTDEDIQVQLDDAAVVGNDSDIDGDALTVSWPTQPFVDNTVNPATFTPPTDSSGDFNLTYDLCDSDECVSVAVAMEVRPVNDAPETVVDLITVAEDGSVDLGSDVAGNDTDIEGDPITISWPIQPGVNTGTDPVTFTPPADFNGDINLNYLACDDGNACTAGTATVTVTPINDAPTLNVDPIVILGTEDVVSAVTVADIIGNAIDIDNTPDQLTVNFTDPGDGNFAPTASGFDYTPLALSTAAVTIDFEVCDLDVCSPGQLSLTFTPVDNPPAPQDQTYLVDEDVPLILTRAQLVALASDPDSDEADLIFSFAQPAPDIGQMVVDPATGQLTQVRFSPYQNQGGTADVEYTVCDATSCATGTLSYIIVPVNDPPEVVSAPSSVSAAQFAGLLVITLPTDFVFNDVENDDLTVNIVSSPDGLAGFVFGAFRFTPGPNFTGTTTVQFEVCDATDCTSNALTAWVITITGPKTFYLTNPGTGDTVTSDTLELSEVAPVAAPLANYDTDRDNDPGLTIAQADDGLDDASDADEHQDWTFVATAPTVIDGNAMLKLWVADNNFDSNEYLAIDARLELCQTTCSTVGTDRWEQDATSGFAQADFDLGTLDITLQPGDSLSLRVAVPDPASKSRVMFAYDTATYASALRFE